jgi:hypothetical protein
MPNSKEESEFAPFSAITETHAIFGGLLNFIVCEMIAKNVTTEQRALQRIAEIRTMLARHGASNGALEMVDVMGCLIANAPPPHQ